MHIPMSQPIEKQLLDLFSDLYTYDTKIQEWSIEKFEENNSCLYRLQMIAALMKALGITCSYNDFKHGRFIAKDQFNKWKEFKESILEQLDEKAYAFIVACKVLSYPHNELVFKSVELILVLIERL